MKFKWIFSKFLPPDDLCNVAMTCKMFSRSSSDDIVWIHFGNLSWKESAKHFGWKSTYLQWLRQQIQLFLKRTKSIDPSVTKSIPQVNKTNESYAYLFKLALIGNTGSGKSSLLLRFVDDTFTNSNTSTIGVNTKIRTIDLHHKVVKLQIWDVCPDHRFRTMTDTVYRTREAHGILLVYDSTDLSSFENVQQYWRSEVKRYNDKDISLVLVGNKSDLAKDKAVPVQTASEYALSQNMPFFETSAKTGDGVDAAFQTLSSLIIPRFEGYVSFLVCNDGKPVPVFIPSQEAVKRMVKPLREYWEKLHFDEAVPRTTTHPGSTTSNNSGTTCLLQ